MRALWDRMLELPDDDLSLLVPLPKLLTPDVERLRSAMSDDAPEEAEAVLPPVLARYDTPVVRAGLARSVIVLREHGRIPAHLAAMAVIDLAIDSTTFLQASLLTSVAVLAGATRTPAGLVLAAR